MLPGKVTTAMLCLESAGFEVFTVGGCVRDILLKKTPHDWDLTTSALPEQIIRCFSGFKLILKGLKHGTVTVLIENEPIEITTYRTDGEYPDFRHPESVHFTNSLKADLSRRDFTINAMAMDRSLTIYDFFNGKSDLADKKIRCVGNAQKRFSEDALRILRGMRFASTEGFSLEEKTLTAINALAPNLKHIAPERIAAELKKMLTLPNAGSIIQQTLPVFKILFSSLSCSAEQWTNTCAYITASGCRAELSFAHILGLCDFKEELARLKIENTLKKKIRMLLENRETIPENNKKSLTRVMCRLGREDTMLLLHFLISCNKADPAILHTALLAAAGCCSIHELDINGNDLKLLGIKDRAIGKTLRMLLTAVTEEKCENKKDQIISYLSKNNIL